MAKRKLTPEEKESRKHQRAAEKANAMAKQEAGMFAFAVEEVTAADAYWRWRFNKALHAGERCSTLEGHWLFGELQESVIRREVARIVGAHWFALLDAHRWRVYPTRSCYGFWEGVMTGERIVLTRIPAGTRQTPYGTFNVHRDGEVWPPADFRPWTREQFWKAFPYKDEEPPPGGFDDWGDAILRSLATKSNESGPPPGHR